MNRKDQTTEVLERKMKGRPSYGKAIRIVEKFLEGLGEDRKRESIKINPYAEYPWISFPELTSSRWE